MSRSSFLIIFMAIFSSGCLLKLTETSSQVQWEGGHPLATVKNCATCHSSIRPIVTITKIKTTSNGRSYTVHFHNLVPTGFVEDPGVYNDCSSCHTHAAGWAGGNFGPLGDPHLTDSVGTQVTRCIDCHDYPADFWRTEHTSAQGSGYDCSVCHLLPTEVGGTQPGGFGDL
jgi:hypothetical protein